MVGKLNDMLSAAVFIDSLSTKSSSTQSSNATASVKQSESGQSAQSGQPSLSTILKSGETTQSVDAAKQAEEEKQQGQAEHLTKEETSQLVEASNKFFSKNNINLEMTYDPDAEMINVKVIEKSTQKVIREFPPEELLESIKRANEKSRDFLGALIDRLI